MSRGTSCKSEGQHLRPCEWDTRTYTHTYTHTYLWRSMEPMHPPVCSWAGIDNTLVKQRRSAMLYRKREHELTNYFCWRLLGEGQKGRQKGDGKKKRQKMSWQTGPLPLQPDFVRGPPPPRPLMSSEAQRKGELARDIRGSKDRTNGRERDALSWHFLSRPLPGVPFWPSPSFTSLVPSNTLCNPDGLLENWGARQGAHATTRFLKGS